jgi:hypothetical protein
MSWVENPSVDSIDPNVWYAITESRVNFTSAMEWKDNGMSFQVVADINNQYWQFFKLDNGNWNLRNQAGGTSKQFGAYFSASETAASKTRVGIVTASDSESQEWTIDESWDDGTYRIQNVGNGTNYNLDVHVGTPIFMSDVLDAEPKQVAQHWMISSRRDINDDAYSTAFARVRRSSLFSRHSANLLQSTSTSSSPASSSAVATAAATTDSSSNSAASTAASSATSSAAAGVIAKQKSSHGLSPGAAAGIGVGVALGIIAAAAIFFLLFRRRRTDQRRNHQQLERSAELGSGTEWRGTGPPLAAVGGEKKDVVLSEQSVEAPSRDVVYQRSELPTPPTELPGHEVEREATSDLPHSAHGDESTKTSSPLARSSIEK